MTDEELYQLCKKWGKKALEARRKFAGLLPEVFKRKLYEKKGFSSIFEFAAKLAGMSKEQVNLILRLDRVFEDKPVLKEALVSGEMSANKLVRVVSIATKENQEELFQAIKLLSNRAIEVLVRDIKMDNLNSDDKESLTLNGSTKPLFDLESMHVHNLKLDKDVEEKLFEMQEKGIDVNEFLRSALKKREKEIGIRKEEIVEKQRLEGMEKTLHSRYIPSEVRKIIAEEYGTKCSYPGCKKSAKIFHHTQRFALAREHDPHFIAPLCEAHHEIAHKIDVKYVQKASG